MNLSDFKVFDCLINSMDRSSSDAADLSNGARFIPGEVTLARRRGEKVQFQMPCGNQCCWYWQMPDGSRIYHWEKAAFDYLNKNSNGVCESCGNNFINGGTMSAAQSATHKQKKSLTNTSRKDSGRNLLAHAMRIGGPRAIEAQEEAGQQELVNSDTLPSEIDSKSKSLLEAAGVKFGNPVEHDPLFQYVELPTGWKKVPTDHSMWSDLVDDKGVVRAQIFYKAAFYDRRADIRATES